MTVETAVNFEQLNDLFPEDDQSIDGEPISEDNDHIQLIKLLEKTMFAGVTGNGFSIPITAYEDELNQCVGLVSNLQAQIDNIKLGSIPIGGCIMYSGANNLIPANFFLCNGANGTPDLTDKFVYGTATENEINSTGGSNNSVNVAHSHDASHPHVDTAHRTGVSGEHDHVVNLRTSNTAGTAGTYFQGGLDNFLNEIYSSLSGMHSHTALFAPNTDAIPSPTTENGIGLNRPNYLTLAWIQRAS